MNFPDTQRFVRAALVAAATLCAPLYAATPTAHDLAKNTVFIVRHAEKPALGRELTSTGQARAGAYVQYFEPFHDGGLNLRVNALYAGADSADSIRPRLTLEPLSHATGLPLDSSVSTKDPAALVALLRTQRHGNHPLVAWRHGSIPALLIAFGASPELIPGGKWPNDTYDWVVVLSFDSAGHLRSSRLIQENLKVPKSVLYITLIPISQLLYSSRRDSPHPLNNRNSTGLSAEHTRKPA